MKSQNEFISILPAASPFIHIGFPSKVTLTYSFPALEKTSNIKESPSFGTILFAGSKDSIIEAIVSYSVNK